MNLRYLICGVLVAAGAFFSTPDAGAQADAGSAASSGNDPEAIELLRKMEQQYAGIQTISGSFRQTRQDGTFGNSIVSQANFYIQKPNKFRADYQPPHESSNLITDDYYYQYTKDLQQVMQFKFQNRQTVQDLNYMLLGFGVRTEDLLKVYRVRQITKGVPAGYQGLQFDPVDKKNANFEYITILVTTDGSYRPAQFSMEQNGSRTTADLDLQNLKLGVSISSSRFKPDWPRNVNVVQMR